LWDGPGEASAEPLTPAEHQAALQTSAAAGEAMKGLPPELARQLQPQYDRMRAAIGGGHDPGNTSARIEIENWADVLRSDRRISLEVRQSLRVFTEPETIRPNAENPGFQPANKEAWKAFVHQQTQPGKGMIGFGGVYEHALVNHVAEINKTLQDLVDSGKTLTRQDINDASQRADRFGTSFSVRELAIIATAREDVGRQVFDIKEGESTRKSLGYHPGSSYEGTVKKFTDLLQARSSAAPVPERKSPGDASTAPTRADLAAGDTRPAGENAEHGNRVSRRSSGQPGDFLVLPGDEIARLREYWNQEKGALSQEDRDKIWKNVERKLASEKFVRGVKYALGLGAAATVAFLVLDYVNGEQPGKTNPAGGRAKFNDSDD
jgi:hypothetical protein